MSAPRIDSKIVPDDELFRARAAHNRALAEKLRADVAEAAKGGPEKHRKRHVEAERRTGRYMHGPLKRVVIAGPEVRRAAIPSARVERETRLARLKPLRDHQIVVRIYVLHALGEEPPVGKSRERQNFASRAQPAENLRSLLLPALPVAELDERRALNESPGAVAVRAHDQV